MRTLSEKPTRGRRTPNFSLHPLPHVEPSNSACAAEAFMSHANWLPAHLPRIAPHHILVVPAEIADDLLHVHDQVYRYFGEGQVFVARHPTHRGAGGSCPRPPPMTQLLASTARPPY